MIKAKKYLRFWLWIDLIGLALSIILVISYLLWGDDYNDHIQNLWSNLSIEVFGVWISVRIIDYLLQCQRQFRDIRFHQLRTLQYFFDLATQIWQYHADYERDIERLRLEKKYFEKRWPKRQSKFYKDERHQIDELKNQMPIILSAAESMQVANQNLSEFYDKEYTERNENEEKDLKKSQTEMRIRLKELLSEYLTKLEVLRENVWQETHPDD